MKIDGFDGGDKLFLMEFSMPNDGKSGFNADMPAIVSFLLQFSPATQLIVDSGYSMPKFPALFSMANPNAHAGSLVVANSTL